MSGPPDCLARSDLFHAWLSLPLCRHPTSCALNKQSFKHSSLVPRSEGAEQSRTAPWVYDKSGNLYVSRRALEISVTLGHINLTPAPSI